MINKCSICLEYITDIYTTICNHTFHIFCIKKWLSIKTTCPMCRKPLRDIVDEDYINEEDEDSWIDNNFHYRGQIAIYDHLDRMEMGRYNRRRVFR